jgi:UPF0755 protein
VKLRIVLAVFLSALTVAAAAGAWFRHALWGSRSVSRVEIEVSAGSTASEILAGLHEDGLLPSVLAGRLYIRIRAEGRSFHYGRYVFESGRRPVDVLETILDGRVEMFEVTIIEGSEAEDIGDQFAALGVGSAEDWRALRQNADWIVDIAPEALSLEGFLFPDTYRFAVGIPAEQAARHLVDRFKEVWRQEAQGIREPWGSVFEIVTLASLVEAETSLDAERARIAGVFVNRLRRGMLLQCDPTVVYALKRRNEWRGRLLRIHWEIDHPYNTYRNPGLPPGPINSPGRAALRAALHPESTPYLYFVAQPGGGHTFSSTLTEHNRAVARLRRAGR